MGRPMFNPTQIVVEAFVGELQVMYERTYGVLEPSYPGIIGFVGRLALENIANSDAAYHDVNHTIMVTVADISATGVLRHAIGCISSFRFYATTLGTSEEFAEATATVNT